MRIPNSKVLALFGIAAAVLFGHRARACEGAETFQEGLIKARENIRDGKEINASHCFNDLLSSYKRESLAVQESYLYEYIVNCRAVVGLTESQRYFRDAIELIKEYIDLYRTNRAIAPRIANVVRYAGDIYTTWGHSDELLIVYSGLALTNPEAFDEMSIESWDRTLTNEVRVETKQDMTPSCVQDLQIKSMQELCQKTHAYRKRWETFYAFLKTIVKPELSGVRDLMTEKAKSVLAATMGHVSCPKTT